PKYARLAARFTAMTAIGWRAALLWSSTSTVGLNSLIGSVSGRGAMPLPDGQASDDQSMRIAIVSDAWQPQVNGVVRTLERLLIELATLGHVAEVIGPDHFRSIPCPTYPDIRLSFAMGPRLAKLIEAVKPSAIHIATEGPLGWAARS